MASQLIRDAAMEHLLTPKNSGMLIIDYQNDTNELAKQSFADEELVNLTRAVITINGWNRLAISFRSVPGLPARNA